MFVREGYTYRNTAEEILAAAKGSKTVFETMRREASQTIAEFADRPEWISGWGHDFVCPKCASQLLFDVHMPFKDHNEYRCPACGQVVSGIGYDDAWVYYYRYHYAKQAENVAVCAAMGDGEALDFLICYVDFYAQNYEGFPYHTKRTPGTCAGMGKIMAQSLCEAVWALSVIRALAICREMIPDGKKNEWYQKLFRPLCDIIIPQANTIHNIPTWIMCAVGAVGIYFEDADLLDFALNNPIGIRRQVEEGFTADGIWHEGSLLYHYYTVEALTEFMSLYAEKAPNDALFDSHLRMYTAPLLLSRDGFSLPALNDGWYPLDIARQARMILLADRMFDHSLLRSQLDVIRAKCGKVLEEPFALIYGKQDDGITVLPATGLAVLHHPVFVILKSGSMSYSHRHRDDLSITLPPFSDDLGSPGYAHPMTKTWYRAAPSHNTVCVDGGQATELPEMSIQKIACGIKAEITSPQMWQGIAKATRTLTVADGGVVDVTEFKSAEQHTYDWFFHSVGKAEYDCDGESISTIEGGNGYEHFSSVKRMKTGKQFSARFISDDGEALALTVENAETLEIYTAQSPDNPGNRFRSSVILRCVGCCAEFRVKITRS